MERREEAEQIARTESLFREVNERIAESAGGFGAHDADFVCECADCSCTHRISASLSEYEDARRDGTTFLLVPGHEDERVEAVVARRDGHAVVRKRHPLVAAIAQRLNPRTA